MLAENRKSKISGRKINWLVTIVLAAIHAVAIAASVRFYSLDAVGVAFVLYLVTGLFGVSLGYHRLLAHRSFRAPKIVERILATCGALTLQGGPLQWVAVHRMHHAYSDTGSDPHNARRGFWWSHMLWMCFSEGQRNDPIVMRKFARDIAADPYLVWLGKVGPQFLLQALMGIFLFYLGGWNYVVWGMLVRCCVFYHVTWLLNSAAHKYGYKNFTQDDLSTNCWWVALLDFGDGWHNNHHAFPDSATNGIRWWEFDITWQVIRLMNMLGIASDIKMANFEI